MASAIALKRSASFDADEGSIESLVSTWRDAVRTRVLARHAHEPWPSRSKTRWALFVIIVFHLALLIGLRGKMQRRFVPGETKIQVQLLDLTKPEPVLPQPAPKAPRDAKEAMPAVAQRIAAPRRPDVSALPAPERLQLYDPDGSLRVPSSPEFRRSPAQERYSWQAINARNHNPLHCRKTDRTSTEDFESLGDKIARNPVLQFLGLGNPLNQQRVQERKAAADAACDGDF